MNTQEYLAAVADVLAKEFRANDVTGSMTAASAAFVVRQHLGAHFTEYGFIKFKDVLQVLESHGQIRTGLNSKQALAIWPANALGSPSTTQIPSRVQFLRPSVWFAFISGPPSGNRYLNRETGEVRLGLSQSPGGDWIEIDRLDPDEDKAEANRFIANEQLDANQFATALDSDLWYVEFPKALFAHDRRLASAWKRLRTNRVVAHVENWRERNNLRPELLFEPEDRSSIKGFQRQSPSGIREILLSAIQQMTTDELLRLAIPPRLLVAALRPELLEY